MARKFSRRKGLKKRAPYKRRATKRGRRRLGDSGNSPFMYDDVELNLAKLAVTKAIEHVSKTVPFQPYKGKSFRGTAPSAPKKKQRLHGMMPAGTAATIKKSGGLRIGRYRKSTFREKVEAVRNPPVTFNSKWIFQVDAPSAYVGAVSVPILNKTLLDPIVDQLYKNLTTDSGFAPGVLDTNDSFQNGQYSIMIHSYRSKLHMYNSSTNTLRGRIVWYKPTKDFDGQYETYGAHTHSPINTLMLASNMAQPDGSLYSNVGTVFNTITDGLNYNADYHHAGWPLTGANTTAGNTSNVVATLDPSLVPGNSHVRRFFNQFWRTLKSEEFNLEPGQQFDTHLTMMSKMVSNVYDDADMIYRRNCSVVGVIYILGQMVFGENAAEAAITTGNSQLSVMREDTCRVQVRQVKKEVRLNMTNPYQTIASNLQAKINDESGILQDIYQQDVN